MISPLGFTIGWSRALRGPTRPPSASTRLRKINAHGPDWPERPGCHGAAAAHRGRRELCSEREGTPQEVLDLLKRKGVTPEVGPATRPCARGPSTSVYFRERDGNLVELTVYDQPS